MVLNWKPANGPTVIFAEVRLEPVIVNDESALVCVRTVLPKFIVDLERLMFDEAGIRVEPLAVEPKLVVTGVPALFRAITLNV